MKRCSVWFGPWLALWLLALTPPLSAGEQNLYSAAVPVSSQSVPARARAASEGLAKVLVRASGVTDITSASSNVQQILSNASQYVDRFHYEQIPDGYGGVSEQLVMSFTPAVIERLLQQAGLPLWPVNRPEVLVWLVVDSPEEGRRLTNDPSTQVARGLLKGAAERGLQLKWPLLDLDDQLAINANDVWSFEESVIMEASERYQVDTILVGRYTQTSAGQWWTSWQYFHRGDNQFYDLRLEDGVLAGERALAPIADYLADRYSVFTNTKGEPRMMIQISAVEDFSDYRGVLDYLRQLALVTSSRLVSVNGSTLLMAVQLSGDEQKLRNALSLDKKLRLEAEPSVSSSPWTAVPSGTESNPLRLEWIGR